MRMQFFIFFILVMTVFLFTGCSSSDTEKYREIPGQNNEDNKKIELEKNEINATGEANTVFVKAENSNWYISSVKVTDHTGETTYKNELYVYDDGKNQYNRYRDTISNEWFAVSPSYLEIYGLIVDLKENNTEKERKLFIRLTPGGAGLYGDSLTVIQNSL